MKTKLTKKQIEIEIAKVNLFNTIYGTNLETEVYNDKQKEWIYNGVTLAMHIEKETGISMRYMGYGIQQAKRLFKEHVKELTT